MKFIIEDNYIVKIFGLSVNRVQHLVILFCFAFCLLFIWPMIMGTKLFFPFAVCALGILPAEWVYSELIESGILFKILMYLGLIITTTIYTYFFLDDPLFIKLLHYAVYFSFGYIYSKKVEVPD